MTGQSWTTEDILVTVRAYPNPSKRYRETSCVAGIRLRDGAFVRLHPIPYRDLSNSQRFRKYDIIRARIKKSSDPRAESFRVDLDSPIEIVGKIDTKNDWEKRHEILRPHIAPSVEWLRNESGKSLGLVRVRDFQGLVIEPQEGGWTPQQLARLNQSSIFGPVRQLERPPFRFRYRFRCDGPHCRGHNMTIIDWEVIESFRRWRQHYGESTWEEKFRLRYEQQLPDRDLHLFLGNMFRHHDVWLVIGVYYPPQGSV